MSSSASLVELAEDWLTAKRALESADQAEKGNSDRARRADLERWALVLGEIRGRPPAGAEPLFARLRLSDLSEDVLVGAMATAKVRWSDATVARMLSSLRGFTRWLHRTGHLSSDPLDGDLFRAPTRPERRPRSPDAEDVERTPKTVGTGGLGRVGLVRGRVEVATRPLRAKDRRDGPSRRRRPLRRRVEVATRPVRAKDRQDGVDSAALARSLSP